MIVTPAQKLPYLQRLVELVEIDGNTNSWTDKRKEMHDVVVGEILINRDILKQDDTIPADLGDIREL
jgi:hypothetical protein